MKALSLALLLLPPSLAQVDVPSQLEAIEFASRLDAITQGLLQVDSSVSNLGALPKDTISLDIVAVADAALGGIATFLDGVAATLEQQRDLIEATYLQPSSKTQCILPNLVADSDLPADFQFNPLYDMDVSIGSCALKSPASEDTLSSDFFDWIPTLMDTVVPNEQVLYQYFGDARTGNMAMSPYFYWPGESNAGIHPFLCHFTPTHTDSFISVQPGYGYDPRGRPWYTAGSLYGPKDFVIVLDIVNQENFLLASEFISILLSRLSGQDYVNVVAKNQLLLQVNNSLLLRSHSHSLANTPIHSEHVLRWPPGARHARERRRDPAFCG